MRDDDGFATMLSGSQPTVLDSSDDGNKFYSAYGVSAQLADFKRGYCTSQSISLRRLTHPLVIRAGRLVSNGEALYLASRGDGWLLIYDAARRRVQGDLSWTFQPRAMDEFGLHSSLLASRAKAGDPFWFFQNAPWPAAFFVPPTRASSREDSQ
jgi:hypothetical protein